MFGDLRGKRITVMGLGRFGGGVGAVRFLAERGARVTVTDHASEESLAESLAQIAHLPLERLRLGGHDDSDFHDADLIVASPAVPANHPLLAAAEAAGVPITTEIGLFWASCRGRVIGVTGSIGKSTTSAMIHAILAGSGRTAWLGGNIGGSLLPEIDRIGPDDWVVLELSSFQLERLAPLKPRPRVAVVTNLRPNHLDRHGTLDAYRDAKQNLLRWQTPEDVAVLNVDDPDVSTWPTAARIWWFGRAADDPALAGEESRFLSPDSKNIDQQNRGPVAEDGRRGLSPKSVAPEGERDFRGLGHAPLGPDTLDSSDLQQGYGTAIKTPPAVMALSSDNAFLAHDGREPMVFFLDRRQPGEHHRLNAAAAVAATVAVGVEPQSIADALNAFRGLPHRSEALGEIDGRLWVNDSKATTPESAVAALRSFDRPVRLIAGGADKGVDLSPLADEITRRDVAVYLSGKTGPAIAELLAKRGCRAFTLCETFDESVTAARADSQPGDVILLSPGCASWGQFRDYRERGERFAVFANLPTSLPTFESRT